MLSLSRGTWICDVLESGSSILFREQKNWTIGTKNFVNNPGRDDPTTAPFPSNHYQFAQIFINTFIGEILPSAFVAFSTNTLKLLCQGKFNN